MTDEASNGGRVTLKDVYDLLADIRKEFMAKLDELPNQYATIDAVNAHDSRIRALEGGTVRSEVHELCRAQVTNIESDVKQLQQKVWFIAGGAAAVGSVASLIVSHFIAK